LMTTRDGLGAVINSFNSQLEELRLAAPSLVRDIPAVSLSQAWSKSALSKASSVALLQDSLIILQRAEIVASQPIMSKVAVATESASGLREASIIDLGRLGTTASSESADFDRIFPREVDWTKSRLELSKSVTRMPGGVIIDPLIRENPQQRITGIAYDF